MRWDYTVVNDLESARQMGQEGWELVSVVHHSDTNLLAFYLKRPAQNRVGGRQ